MVQQWAHFVKSVNFDPQSMLSCGMELVAGENDRGRRLDRVLRKALMDCPLPLLHRLLRQKRVLVNGKPARAQYRLDCGDTVRIPSLKDAPRAALVVKTLPPPDILWQGMGLLAVNKPPALAVHGPGSLDEMVRSFLADKLPPSLSFKSGPLHRLDKPSSGIVVFSTSLEGARLFSSLLRERKVRKIYLAIVEGTVKNGEIWEDKLLRDREMKKTFVSNPDSAAGKTAITKIKPLANKGGYSLIMAEIATGRTHQIRAQAACHGHPLAGDIKYGGGKGGFFLHAWKLEFLEHLIEAPLPMAFREKITALFGEGVRDVFSSAYIYCRPPSC
jgi:23S rRNA pseudouridine955/2504/2580 synthase